MGTDEVDRLLAVGEGDRVQAGRFEQVNGLAARCRLILDDHDGAAIHGMALLTH